MLQLQAIPFWPNTSKNVNKLPIQLYVSVHVCNNGLDRAVSNPADQCCVFQLASSACSRPVGVRLLSQSVANPLRTDQCRGREMKGGRLEGGREGGMEFRLKEEQKKAYKDKDL